MHDCSSTAAQTFLLAVILAALGGSGCEFMGPTDRKGPRFAVEAYLIAGTPLPRVRVMEIAPIEADSGGGKFEARAAGITGAKVQVARLSSSGSNERAGAAVAERFPYEPHPSIPGVHVPVDSARVVPTASYRLRVEVAGSEQPIIARTTVPDTFRVQANAPDTITYRKDEYLPLPVSTSRYPGRAPIYQLNTTVPDPTLEKLTPVGDTLVSSLESLAGYAGAVDEGYTVGSLAGNEWPLTRAASYPRPDPTTIRIAYPWRAVLFYGPNHIAVYALGDNLYDYIRSISAQKQNAGPGGFTGVIDHVDGGTGVFGGLAQAEQRVVIQRPDN